MYSDTYERLAQRQDSYWWHHARRDLAIGWLRRFTLGPGGRAIDLGCGPGGNLSIFSTFSPRLVAGVDVSPIALELARRTGGSNAFVRANLSSPLPFADKSADVITIFNVLYHKWIANPGAVLNEAARILRPGGLLVMTEPAFRSLERQMDRAAMGARRFTAGEVSSLCRAAHLDVLRTSYFTSFGAPAAWFMSVLTRKSPPEGEHDGRHADHAAGDAGSQADFKPLASPLNALLYAVARVEAWAIVSGLRVPFGVALACVARKPA